MKTKWFHVIGICGKATSRVAKMFQDMGWFVTGSDIAFSPPASTFLEENGIPIVEGYHYSHMTRGFWVKQLAISNEQLENKDQGLKTKDHNEMTNDEHRMTNIENDQGSKNKDQIDNRKSEIVNSNITNLQSLISNLPEHPNLGLIVEYATSKNKELQYAKLHGVDIRPYSQILGEYLVKQNSIVVVGTAGKTTTTALLVHVFKSLGLDPSYMVAGDMVNHKEGMVNTNSDWSIMEGDEYHSLEFSRGAKFLEYKPKYIVITNIGWEHQDIFPTKERYVEEFKKLVRIIPEDGLIVAKFGDENIDEVVREARCKVVRYGIGEVGRGRWDMGYGSQEPEVISHKPEAISPLHTIPLLRGVRGVFVVNKSDGTTNYKIYNDTTLLADGQTSLLGYYNIENIVATYALINELDTQGILKIDPAAFKIDTGKLTTEILMHEISQAITNFKGVEKRLEILHKDNDVTIVDDFGVAPNRAKNSLETLRDYYPNHYIVGIFEPNSGSRIKDGQQFKEAYANVFNEADEIIIPELSKFSDGLADENDFIVRLKEMGVKVSKVESADLEKFLILKMQENREKRIEISKEEGATNLKSQISILNSPFLIVFFSSYRLTQIARDLADKMKTI